MHNNLALFLPQKKKEKMLWQKHFPAFNPKNVKTCHVHKKNKICLLRPLILPLHDCLSLKNNIRNNQNMFFPPS